MRMPKARKLARQLVLSTAKAHGLKVSQMEPKAIRLATSALIDHVRLRNEQEVIRALKRMK